MDIYAQNIANASTSGYKQERISFKEHLVASDNALNVESKGRVMTKLSEISTDFSSGSFMRTDNPLDMAINGKGFFALEGNKYTRNGNFMIDSEGFLVNNSGTKVLGDGGPLTVEGGKIDISSSGEVFVDDISVGRLQIVDFKNKSVLKKMGGGVFTTKASGDVVDSSVSQGYLEQSNVNVIKELMRLIISQREFQSYQKMIQAFDEASSKTINEMGK